jgi:hypothetical protein
MFSNRRKHKFGVMSSEFGENDQTNIFLLSPGACLREAASAKAGEREGVRGRRSCQNLKLSTLRM